MHAYMDLLEAKTLLARMIAATRVYSSLGIKQACIRGKA